MKVRIYAIMFVIGISAILAQLHGSRAQDAIGAGDDWPLFRGDALQTGVARTTLPDKLEVRWKVQLKRGKQSAGIESTAAIVKDTVYIGAFDDHLHAFDLATGQERWKLKTGAIKAAPSV